eukprot:m.126549 g.126549  ORF g.126549 m.126549 type:complete len:873 (-) comp16682_c0_seq4:2058-4676(-)
MAGQGLAATVQQARQVLEDPNSEIDTILCSLGCVTAAVWPAASEACCSTEFASRHYLLFADSLLRHVVVGWLPCFGRNDRKRLFDVFFDSKRVPPHCILAALSAALARAREHHAVETIAQLIRNALRQDLVSRLVTHATTPQSNVAELKAIAAMVVSLPDKLANALGRSRCQTQDAMRPAEYFDVVGRQLAVGLAQTATEDGLGLGIVSAVVAKLAAHGRAQPFLASLMTWLLEQDLEATRLVQRCASVLVVHDRSIAKLAEALVAVTPRSKEGYNVLTALLAPLVNSHQALRLALSHTFLLVRWFPEDHMLHACARILCAASGELLLSALCSVMEVWGDPASLRACPAEQHFYMSKALVVLLAHLPPDVLATHTSRLMSVIARGVQPHLASSVRVTRGVGMMTATLILRRLHPDHPLAFDIEDLPHVQALRALDEQVWQERNAPTPDSASSESLSRGTGDVEPAVCAQVGFAPARTSHDGGLSAATTASHSDRDSDSDDPDADFFASLAHGKGKTAGAESVRPTFQDDSDDEELEAFAIPEEGDGRDSVSSKSPRYIRDCLEGLRSGDNVDLIEACLKAAQGLIEADPGDLKEVCEELTRTLLHMSNQYNLDGFVEARQGALVAIACACPTKVARMLTREFYELDYSIGHRQDMLQTLCLAATKLSQYSGATPAATSSTSRTAAGADGASVGVPTPREIVEMRLAAKTRRFASPTKLAPPGRANRFAAVAGEFFYPLLRYFDRPVNTFDLLGADSMLLALLIRTLGVVINAAGSAPCTLTMAVTFVHFGLGFRYHHDPFVRQALSYAFLMVFRAVDLELLLMDVAEELTEVRLWLQAAVQKDPDNLCRELAAANLYQLHQTGESLGALPLH